MLLPASMLKKPFTRAWLQIVLSCPLGFYFHSPAELTMYALLFISSTYRETRCPSGCISEFLLSFWLSLTLSWLPLSLSLSLHPLTSHCFVSLVILPRLHHSSHASPQKMRLFRHALIFRLISNKLHSLALHPSDHQNLSRNQINHESLGTMQH